MMADRARARRYTRRSMVHSQVKASRTLAAVHRVRWAGWRRVGAQTKSPATAVRAEAPASSSIQKIPTHVHSNHTRLGSAFLLSISIAMIGMINMMLATPTKMRYASI